VRSWYEAHPDTYLEAPGSADRIAKSLSFVRLLRPTTVVDVGSGAGGTAQRIQHETQADIVCFDISPAAVNACRERGLNAGVLDIDQEDLPLPDSSVDVVLMTEVIEHLVDPDRALQRVRRVLNANGHLVLSTPNIACVINRVMLPIGLQPFHSEVSTRLVLGRRFAFLGEGAKPVGHLRLFTYRALSQVLQLNGFRVEDARGATVLKQPAFRTMESLFNWRPSLASLMVVLAAKA